MLRVTVELVPGGDESRKRELAKMIIGNIGGSFSRDGHDYVYAYVEHKPLTGERPLKGSGALRRYDRNAPVMRIIHAVLDRGESPRSHYEEKMIGVCEKRLED